MGKLYIDIIPPYICTTPIVCAFYGENINPEGAPEIVTTKELKCMYQDTAHRIRNKEKDEVQINGIAYFCHDILPECATISSGIATINGEKRNIIKGEKARNPDGTVNFTKLELS